MRKVLVAVASKHGATAELAQAIGDALAEAGCETTVASVEQIASCEPYDAVVLGSAVYMGRWMAEARELAERHRDALAARPLWLFSSGPVGDPPKPEEPPPEADALAESLGARGHKVLAGKVARGDLGFWERRVISAFRVEDRDDRDWPEARAWAAGIAADLDAAPAA